MTADIKELGFGLTCPHCSGEINVKLDIRSSGNFIDQKPKHELPRIERFSSYEVNLLDLCERDGILAAFANAARQAKGSQSPKDMDRFFLGFLRTCAKVVVPAETLNVLRREFPGQEILIYSTQGVVMILADGRPELFAPEVFARTSKTQADKMGAFKIPAPAPQLEEWIRTKNGYVSGKGLLWAELKGKSAGHFARPSI